MAPPTYTPGAPGAPLAASQEIDHRLLEKVHELAHLDAATPQVDKGVDHELAGPVIGDVAAAVGLHERDGIVERRMLGALPQRVDRRMLEQPQLVGSIRVPFPGELLHRLERGGVIDLSEALDRDLVEDDHRTMTTEG